MARNKGTFIFSANLQVKSAAALDPRTVVDTKADLINKETWPYDGETIYVFKGLQVAVAEEQAVYMLIDPTKILETDYSGWKKIDASAATVIEVVDNLLSTKPNAALSANQGKILNDKISEISAKLTAIFTFKGSKATLEEINAIESPSVGDVWHNAADGGEYVYDGDSWELLGISVDLGPYAKTADVTANINAAKEELNNTITTTATDLQGKIDAKVDKAAGKSLVEDTLIDQITQNKSDITSINTALGTKVDKTTTVNGKELSSNVTITGEDVTVGGTGANKAKTVAASVEDLYNKVAEAKASGVTSFAGKTGDILIDETGSGTYKVALSISDDKKLGASISGLGTAAAKAADAFDAAGAADAVKTAVIGSSADASSANTIAAAKKYADEKSGAVKVSVTNGGYVTGSVDSAGRVITLGSTVQTVSSASDTAKGLAEASDVKTYVDNKVSSYQLTWTNFA